MKRIFALLLACLMLFTLAACNKAASSSQPNAPASSSTPDSSVAQAQPDVSVQDDTDEPADDTAATTFSPETLAGTWVLEAWSMLDGTSFTTVADQYMVFTETELAYYVSGALTSDNTYAFASDTSITLTSKADTSVSVEWGVGSNDDYELVITDNLLQVYYYLYRTDSMDSSEKTPVSAAELAGVWEIQNYNFGGVETPVENGYFYFTKNAMYYYQDGAHMTDNSYVFTDDTTIQLTSRWGTTATVSWGVYKNEEGQLVCADPTGITYLLEPGYMSRPALEGTWEMYAWSMLDGSEYTEIIDNYLQFAPGSRMQYNVNGFVAADNEITALDRFAVRLSTPGATGGVTSDWTFVSQGSYSVITDKSLGILYYIRRVADLTLNYDIPWVWNDVPQSELVGKWTLKAWDIVGGGYYTEVSGQNFTFTDSEMTYNIEGAAITNSTYSAANGALMLTDTTTGAKSAWGINRTADGIMFTDPATYVMYYLVKDNSVEQPVISQADLIGSWNIDAWDIVGGGYYTEVTDNKFVFTDADMKYTIGGGTITDNAYVLNTSSVTLTDKTTGTTVTWGIRMDGDTLIFTDTNYVMYYCTKDSGDEPPPAEPVISQADLMGTWNIDAWDLIGGGMYTAETGKKYVFTDTTMTYTVDSVTTTSSSYTLTNTSIVLTDLASTWNIAMDGDTLVITDPAAYLVYYCTKDSGDEPPPPPAEPVISQADLMGTWTISAWSADWVNYVAVTGQELVFTDTDMKYMTNAAVTSDNTYVLTDTAVVLTDKTTSGQDTWTIVKDGENLIFYSYVLGAFYCTKAVPIEPAMATATLNPVENPVEEPATEEPATEEPAQEAIDEPVQAPATEPVEEATAEPAADSAIEPAVEPTEEEPVAEPAEEPV